MTLSLNFRLSNHPAPTLTLEEVASQQTPERFICPVLQNDKPMLNPMLTRCKHVFDNRVITELFNRAIDQGQLKISCPMCRRELTVEDVKKYFRLEEVIRSWKSLQGPDPLQDVWDLALRLQMDQKLNFKAFTIINLQVKRGHELTHEFSDDPEKVSEITERVIKITDMIQRLHFEPLKAKRPKPEMAAALKKIASQMDEVLNESLLSHRNGHFNKTAMMSLLLLRKQSDEMIEYCRAIKGSIREVNIIPMYVLHVMGQIILMEEKFA